MDVAKRILTRTCFTETRVHVTLVDAGLVTAGMYTPNVISALPANVLQAMVHYSRA
jgi:hypothetical protein